MFTFPYYCNCLGDDDEEEEEGGDDGEEGEEKMPTCGDYIMHFLTLFWKVIFATIPPAGKLFFVLPNPTSFIKMPNTSSVSFEFI